MRRSFALGLGSVLVASVGWGSLLSTPGCLQDPTASNDPAPQEILEQGRRLASVDGAWLAMLNPSDHRFALDAGAFVSGGWKQPGKLGAALPAKGDEAWRLGMGPAVLKLTPEQAKPSSGSLQQGKLVYSGMHPFTDVLVASDERQFEWFYLLRNEQAPEEFSFRVGLPAGITDVTEEQGGLSLRDASGHARLQIPRPEAVDAEGKKHPARVSWHDGRLTVKLAHRGLPHPVLLDPVLQLSGGWKRLLAQPSNRTSPDAAPLNGKTVLFGGSSPGWLGDTWEWDGTKWTEKFPAQKPSARSGHSMATLGNKVVLFGGYAQGLGAAADTWEWDGTNWEKKAPTQSPPARCFAAMGTLGSKVVLFGGYNPDSKVKFGDTWEWDGSAWTERKVPGPSPRYESSIGTVNNTIVLVSGGDGVSISYPEETWLWNGSTWSKSADTTLIGYGLQGNNQFLGILGNSHYQWTGSSWQPLSPATKPSFSTGSALGEVGGKTSGIDSKGVVWQWSGSDWLQVPSAYPTLAPATSSPLVMTKVAYQGSFYLYDRDIYNPAFYHKWVPGQGWIVLSTPERLCANSSNDCTCLEFIQDLVCFSGSSVPRAFRMDASGFILSPNSYAVPTNSAVVSVAVVNGKFYTLSSDAKIHSSVDGKLWTLVGPSPTGVTGSGGVGGSLTSLKGKLLYLNGSHESVWQLNGNAWTELTLNKTKPPKRSSQGGVGSLTTVVGDEVLVLFGGGSTGAPLGDTWVFDGADWTQFNSASPPPPHSTHVVFSHGAKAYFTDQATADTWELSLLTGVGQSCGAVLNCESGTCVEGVCCDKPCAGDCEACVQAKTGKPDGTCAPVLKDTDPKNKCEVLGPMGFCQRKGLCDGAGQCETKSGVPCGVSGCDPLGAAKVDYACDDNGACSSKSTSCGVFVCSGAECLSSCVKDEDCQGGYFCQSGSCVASADQGKACAKNSECGSGFCVDGVCCNAACDGVCEACSADRKGYGQNGVCQDVKAGLDLDNECDPDAPATCQKSGTCDGKGACAVYPSGTSCGVTTCTDGKVTGQVCDGQGTCTSAQQPVSCFPYVLCADAQSCAAKCASDNQCAPSHHCDLASSPPTCAEDKIDGSVCTKSGECASGNCTDGVCCNDLCGGACQVCKALEGEPASVNGVCRTLPKGASTQPGHPSCGAGEPGCQSFCDGSSPSCTAPAQGSECAPSTCTATDVVTLARTCDGAGKCEAAKTESCAPFVCDATAKACKTKCSSDKDCSTGAVCSTNGQCTLGEASCADNATAKAPDGSLTSCEPYTCLNGQCRSSCTSDLDCTSLFRCEAQTCVPRNSGAGNGGTAGTGGTVGDGGTAGTGGTAGNGGAGAGGAGAGGAAATDEAVAEDSGCGCRVAGNAGSEGGAVGLLLGLALAARRRCRVLG
jgi:hypothetical protein